MTTYNYDGSSSASKSGAVSSGDKAVDKTIHRYSSDNLSDWNLYQLILTELFDDKNISYLLSPEEIIKRKTPVPLPEYLDPRAEGGEEETPAMHEKLLHDQHLIDDDYRERKKDHRKKELEMENHFENHHEYYFGVSRQND